VRFYLLLLLSFALSAASLAQDIRYVSGEQRVPLRGGAGDDYPVVYRGLEAGTRLTVRGTSEDGQWAEITTVEGVTGWIPTQKLTLEQPAPTVLATTPPPPPTTPPSVEGAGTITGVPAGAPETPVTEMGATPADLLSQVDDCEAQFNAVAQELHRLKQISAKAEQLDIDNRRLVEQQENLRSEIEMLQADNQRLRDKLESESFVNGAGAVLLGVMIALVVPRLVPQRRKNSGWA
jgi:SH3 domain protein